MSFFFSFDSKPMILTPWFQNLAVDKLGVAKVPVLIRLPGLQLKYLINESLARITSLIGTPPFLFSDKMRVEKARLAYARFCVKVGVDDELPNEVKFIGEDEKLLTQFVEYEWKPLRCVHCKALGYLPTECALAPKPSPSSSSTLASTIALSLVG